MWTLLCALEPVPSCRTGMEATMEGGRNGYAVRNGSEPAWLPPGKARIFLCPGHAELGLMDLGQARAQFDLAAARRFRSRREAELACANETGFLIELPARNGHASQGDGGEVVFVERLRR